MSWKFWKKDPPKDRRRWNEDWQVGDTAECIADFDAWHDDVPPWLRLKKGSRYVVKGFHDSVSDRYNIRAYFLVLDGLETSYTCTAFRKVRPIAKEESEIVERILNAKPGRDKVREDAG